MHDIISLLSRCVVNARHNISFVSISNGCRFNWMFQSSPHAVPPVPALIWTWHESLVFISQSLFLKRLANCNSFFITERKLFIPVEPDRLRFP